jgi:metallophosphoesterase (TIGR03768 family)
MVAADCISDPERIQNMCNRHFRLFSLLFVLILQSQLTGCGDPVDPPPVEWPIAKDVYTTAERQVLPVALPAGAPELLPCDVPLYAQYGYSAWQPGVGLAYDKRTDLAPAYAGAPSVARLLLFFSISDIHIADKESPAQPIDVGWSAPFGAPTTSGSAYSPVILSTTQVLDAAVQTINALHEREPFDFGMSLGDACNNTQYNELRWFIDTIDGQVITPSSGDHLGADTIDYQMPFKAAGLNPTLRWFQVMGNHDQFWMGSAFENIKTQQAHIGNTILNMADNADPQSGGVNSNGAYMGVVFGATPYGEIIGAGPQEYYPTPPTVTPDPDRHSLASSTSTTLNWMSEFFNTTSNPVGHGFSQANLDNDFACYSFEPKSDMPIKVIVLDDTCKGPNQPNYAAGCLDPNRLAWLESELQEGQDHDKLMIIAAHVPVNPQQTFDPNSGSYPLFSPTSVVDDLDLLAILHNYPNVILWMAGHRHVNVITPQPGPDPLNHPEQSFWEVETSSLRDFPQEWRIFDIRRNSDNTISIITTDVDPAVGEGSPAAKSRGYAIGAGRIFGPIITDTTSHAYNAELVKQLTPTMQAKIANYGSPITPAGD